MPPGCGRVLTTVLAMAALAAVAVADAGVRDAERTATAAQSSIVIASVRVTVEGRPARPARVVCNGRIGDLRLEGTPRARRGSASCRYRTPAAARGRILVGAIVLVVRGQRFTRRFTRLLGG